MRNYFELKKILRKKIGAERKIFDREKSFSANNEIVKSVQNLLASIAKDSDIIGLYLATRGEPDLVHVIEKYKGRVCAPKIKGTWMDFFNCDDTSFTEESDIKGFMQPKSNEKLQPNIVVLPGYAFSIDGARLGAGIGHYDRYFYDNSDREIIKIAVCFHENLYEYLPQEPHDIKSDYVITDKTIIVL
jgi:5-formyltetrahydrofolate cyclo-ligase